MPASAEEQLARGRIMTAARLKDPAAEHAARQAHTAVKIRDYYVRLTAATPLTDAQRRDLADFIGSR